MSHQNTKAETFRSLHVRGRPLVLFNIWDPGSARAVAAAGARALATGSWSVASAMGFADGEKLPLDLAVANLERIVAATELPVSIDLESGYGATPQAVGQTLSRAIAGGAVGCNLEDSYPETGALRPVAEQVERIRQARGAAEAAGVAFFINARTDVFFQRPAAEHDAAMADEAVERARAYAEAGADGLFAPGVVAAPLIGRIAENAPLPLNIMANAATPDLAVLARLGVARVSHGPGPYVAAMQAVEAAARAALA